MLHFRHVSKLASKYALQVQHPVRASASPAYNPGVQYSTVSSTCAHMASGRFPWQVSLGIAAAQPFMQDLPLKGSPTRIRSTSNGVLLLLGVFMSYCTSNLNLSASAQGLSCAVAFFASVMQVHVSKPESGPRLKRLACFNCGAT